MFCRFQSVGGELTAEWGTEATVGFRNWAMVAFGIVMEQYKHILVLLFFGESRGLRE